jgi:hypothetical protein
VSLDKVYVLNTDVVYLVIDIMLGHSVFGVSQMLPMEMFCVCVGDVDDP